MLLLKIFIFLFCEIVLNLPKKSGIIILLGLSQTRGGLFYFIQGNCLFPPMNTVIVTGVVQIGGQECPQALVFCKHTC